MSSQTHVEGADDSVVADKLWNSWSEKSVAMIFMDAQRINDVFGSIKKQLDYLRQHQFKLQSDFQDLATQSLLLPTSGDKPATSLKFDDFVMKDDLTEFRDLQSSMSEEIRELKEEIDSLRTELRSKNEVETKFQKLEHTISSNYKELSNKYEGLLLQMSSSNLDIQTVQDMLSSLRSDYQITTEGLRKLIEDRFTHLEVNDLTFNKENDLKLNQMKDLIAVQDLKMKQIENKLNNSVEQLKDLNYSFDNFPKNHLDSIHNQLLDLSDNKADRIEVNQKADLIIALNKADQNDFLNLQSLVEEVERRLIQNIQDSTEKLRDIEAKLDHRSDRIVTWCLKQLRKELKSMNLEKEEKEGTDIGKIRCLVCNQVTTQIPNVQDNVFGGPEFHQTIKGYHRGRSRSPPHSNEQNNNNVPEGQRRGNSSPPRERGRERTSSPIANNNTGRGHSRLVHGGHSPHDMSYYQNPNTAYYEQIDPDYMGDFKYRTVSTENIQANANSPTNNNPGGGGGNVTRLPPATKNTQSAPLMQITSVQHPDGNSNMQTSASQKILSQTAGSYKDLEQKLARKTVVGGGGMGSNNAHSQFMKKNRPMSAPMKRSTTTAKLKPMGKIITDDEIAAEDV